MFQCVVCIQTSAVLVRMVLPAVQWVLNPLTPVGMGRSHSVQYLSFLLTVLSFSALPLTSLPILQHHGGSSLLTFLPPTARSSSLSLVLPSLPLHLSLGFWALLV